MTILSVTHKTVYTYASPVAFGEHRMMFRPRDSHDLVLLETSLAIGPTASSVRWIYDVFGNSIALAQFDTQGTELSFTSHFRAKHYPIAPQLLTFETYAERYPFSYASEEIADLGRTVERHYRDPEHQVDLWAREFVDRDSGHETMVVLTAMTKSIHEEFSYSRRAEMGTQDPVLTLTTRTGACRDFALLLMEAARSLGFAARFVSGYLYDESLLDGTQGNVLGAGETHAWTQIYLPGAGWVEFDPTNGLIGGNNLIRIAVTRDPAQAIPLSGSFTGPTGAFLGMTVEVEVTAEPENTMSQAA